MEEFFKKVDKRAADSAEEVLRKYTESLRDTTATAAAVTSIGKEPEQELEKEQLPASAESKEQVAVEAARGEEDEAAAEERRRKEWLQKEKDALRAPFQDLMNQQ